MVDVASIDNRARDARDLAWVAFNAALNLNDIDDPNMAAIATVLGDVHTAAMDACSGLSALISAEGDPLALLISQHRMHDDDDALQALLSYRPSTYAEAGRLLDYYVDADIADDIGRDLDDLVAEVMSCVGPAGGEDTESAVE